MCVCVCVCVLLGHHGNTFESKVVDKLMMVVCACEPQIEYLYRRRVVRDTVNDEAERRAVCSPCVRVCVCVFSIFRGRNSEQRETGRFFIHMSG